MAGPALRKLSPEDRAFFGPLARVIFLNPFSAEREALLGRVSPGHAGEALRLDPKTYAFVTEVGRRIQRLDQSGPVTLQQLEERDRDVMRWVFLYQVYHRHVAELDALIHQQVRSPEASTAIAFADELLAELAKRGFTDEEALRYFAVFYQLRRSFFFILDALFGQSPSMQALRLSLWNSVFTHDMRTYDRALWDRMEDFSTLLLGETGTGKGSAAAAIGRSGLIPFDRKAGRFASSFSRAFIAINLSQFPESLIESELFGHRKGSFTGAIEDHAGLFELCDAHGALFLDEIGEVGVPIQIKLLQVLQERTFTPIGSHAKKRFAGRVIAATNRPLSELRGRGEFRDDFFYRLCSDVIVMPTLRQRIEESPAELDQLVGLLVRRTVGEESGALTQFVLDSLKRDLSPGYPWPGNVRELEQAVRRVLLTGRYAGDTRQREAAGADALVRDVRAGALDARQLMARYCEMLYRQSGTYEEVARRTGLDRRTVRKYVVNSGASAD
jgi:DNA-binding NtrC family response regulator